jgi:hypothetical protein
MVPCIPCMATVLEILVIFNKGLTTDVVKVDQEDDRDDFFLAGSEVVTELLLGGTVALLDWYDLASLLRR